LPFDQAIFQTSPSSGARHFESRKTQTDRIERDAAHKLRIFSCVVSGIPTQKLKAEDAVPSGSSASSLMSLEIQCTRLITSSG